jgi:coenzyme F420-0:L-glutamate ligase / coenzyme F420-1:gamma-L-glutamate ligase
MAHFSDPPERLEVLAITGLPEISPEAPLADLLSDAMTRCGLAFEDGDVLVLAQKMVSKSEGRLVELSRVEASPFACSLAASLGKDARHLEVILRESKRIVRMDAGLILSETRHGFICANAGVDTSNVPEGWVSLLPEDPDASACRLQAEICRSSGKQVAIIVSDTFGRPWREGLTNVAIGVAGLLPMVDYRGQVDGGGHSLSATVIAAADELAAAAEIVMGKLSRRPAAIIRHFRWRTEGGKTSREEAASAKAMIRPREKDLFR